MEKEANDIRSQNLKLAWYMRGGATYDQIMTMSSKEREFIAELVKENMETTKKSGLPHF